MIRRTSTAVDTCGAIDIEQYLLVQSAAGGQQLMEWTGCILVFVGFMFEMWTCTVSVSNRENAVLYRGGIPLTLIDNSQLLKRSLLADPGDSYIVTSRRLGRSTVMYIVW